MDAHCIYTNCTIFRMYGHVCADMQVLDELRHLESYVEDLHKSGTSIRSLYERVQSSGNVLPRLCVSMICL